jgi:hypothetical protein
VGDGFELKAIGVRAPDKAKSLDMFESEPRIAAPATSAPWRLQQAALQVEPHFLNTCTRSPSQLGDSERPRSHPHSNVDIAARPSRHCPGRQCVIVIGGKNVKK